MSEPDETPAVTMQDARRVIQDLREMNQALLRKNGELALKNKRLTRMINTAARILTR